MKEHLARFHMKDGKAIDMHREEGDVSITSPGHSVTLPGATGQQALDWAALLEDLAEKTEYLEAPGGE